MELPASKLLILLNDEDESCHSQSIFFVFVFFKMSAQPIAWVPRIACRVPTAVKGTKASNGVARTPLNKKRGRP